MPQAERIETADVVAVVPARFHSTRFPGKLLADLGGRPVIAHVVDACRRAARVGTVLVATDHHDIADAARAAGARTVLTRADHPSGSDRIGEAVADRPESVILNVQGDEPFVPPSAIDRLVELLERSPRARVSTLMCPAEGAELDDPNVVKVVATEAGRALYFSRAAIPGRHPQRLGERAGWRHLGLYGYRRAALERFLAHPPSQLERQEGLEQLRLLELGETIVVAAVDAIGPGIDTPEDLVICRQRLAGGAGAAGPPRVVSGQDPPSPR